MKLSKGVPTFDEVMLPLLKIAAGGPLTRTEATERVSEAMGLSPEQRAAVMPKGHTVIRDRVGWARTYLVQAGLLRAVKRGVVEITNRGNELLATKPEKIDFRLLMTFPEFQEFHRRSVEGQRAEEPEGQSEGPSDPNQTTPEDRIDAAINEIEVALREALLDRIRTTTPAFFERLVIELLKRMGYGGFRPDAGQHLGGPGDRGVDGMINLDVLGIDRIYIQAKRYSEDNVVAADTVHSFAGALDRKGASRGVFITTSSFTRDALASVAEFRTKQIVLIDGDRLSDLLIEHDVAVREDRRVVIKRLDEDFFEE
jgi:restriction system protein